MRAPLLIALVVLTAGCKLYRLEEPSGAAVGDGGTYAPAPPREVYGTGVIGHPGTGGTGGTIPDAAGGSGGSVPDASPPPPDAALPRDTAPPAPDSAPAEAGGAGDCTACDPIAQDCARGQACYPAAGRSCCQPAGFEGELSPCIDNEQCDRGLACLGTNTGAVSLVCVQLCDPAGHTCPGGTCTSVAGYTGVGYCAP